MEVTSERIAAVRRDLIELYQAMGLEVTLPESINGFRQFDTVAYRLATGPPVVRQIRFFLQLEESDDRPDSVFKQTLAVFIEPGIGTGHEQIHTIPTSDLDNAPSVNPDDASTS